jgi:N-acetylglucosamine kinase-like BadF-type ATPase
MGTKIATLAIEAGGSKGRAALSCGDRIVARSLSVGLNPCDIGFSHFKHRLRSLITAVVRTLSPRPNSLYACAAIAGAGRPEALAGCEKIIREILVPLGARVHLSVMTDVEALVKACLRQADGIVLIAGTGSICLGVKHKGRQKVAARVGGWGSYLDEGCGFRLGLAVLDAVLKTLEGRREARILVDLLCTRYGMGPCEIPGHFIPVERGRVADLARIALEAYYLGDRFSRAIVRRSARDLVGMVLAVREKIGLEDDVVVHISGGLFQSPVITRLFTTRIRRCLPGVRIQMVADPLIHILSLASEMRSS